MTEEKINTLFSSWKMTEKTIILNSHCPYQDRDKSISPLKYIYSNPSADCIAALGRIVPLIDLRKCVQPALDLKDSDLISSRQASFYIASMSIRYRKRLLPAYERHFGPLPKNRKAVIPEP